MGGGGKKTRDLEWKEQGGQTRRPMAKVIKWLETSQEYHKDGHVRRESRKKGNAISV